MYMETLTALNPTNANRENGNGKLSGLSFLHIYTWSSMHILGI